MTSRMGEDDHPVGGGMATKPFTRAPVLLFKSPAVFSAIAGAAAILSLVAASTPLFLSSAGSAALNRELAGRCPASYQFSVTAFLAAEQERDVLEQAFDIPRTLDPVRTVEGSLGQGRLGDERQPMKLMYRTDFADDLEVIDRIDGQGLWMGERLAGWLGASPGDVIDVSNGSVTSKIPLVAITTDLFDRRSEPAWCELENLLEPTSMGDLPTPLVFVDIDALSAEHVETAFANYGPGGLNESWAVPVVIDRLTLDDAQALAAAIEPIELELHDIFDTAGAAETPRAFGRFGPAVHTDLDQVTERVAALVSALGTSIDPLSIAVLVTALGLMGIAGSYWVDRRRLELRTLAVRGVSPAALGAKAGLESAIPVVSGAILGWAAAGPLVRAAGPGGTIGRDAFVSGAARSGVAALAGIGAVVIVAAIRSQKVLDIAESESHNRFGPVLPVAFAATAVWVRSLIGDSAVVAADRQLVGSLDPLVVLYPMLAFAAAALTGGYLLIRVAPRLGRTGHRASWFLAARRIASAPMLATVLVVGAAVPVATLIYSATLTRSTTSTIDAKGRTFIGGDVAAVVYGYESVPDDFADRATVVGKIDRAGITGSQVDILVVDPATFAAGAFFDPSFADEPIDTLLGRLGPIRDGAAPALVANGEYGDGVIDARGMDLPIDVVGRAEAFPGMVRNRPLIVVSAAAMDDAIAAAERKPNGLRYLLWASNVEEQELREALRDDGIGFAFTTPASKTLDLLKFQSVVWTFDFLELYAALAGLIALGAILLYSDTRQRARNLAYALARRMGLSRSDHVRSSQIETAVPLLVGTALGAVTALITARSVYLALDPVPETPPAPRWVPALDLIAVTLAIAVIVSWATARISQRAADTADTSELLRHGG